MSIDLSKLSPAPWDCSQDQNRQEQTAAAILTDANFKTIADTHNSDVACISADHDDDGSWYADDQGRVDLGFCALARNAFDVMMRRHWHPDHQTCAADPGWFVCDQTDTPVFPVQEHGIPCFADPFTALVEADRWYKENVENAASGERG